MMEVEIYSRLPFKDPLLVESKIKKQMIEERNVQQVKDFETHKFDEVNVVSLLV